jgi:formate--tetrahydrofolate ligase
MLEENPEEVQLGADNLLAHLGIVRRHGVTPVVAINAMEGDFASEHAAIREIASSVGVRAAVCTHFENGGKGAVELAEAVVEATADAQPGDFHMLYPDEATLRQKIETVATEIYGAEGVDYLPAAARHLDNYERAGFGTLPVCIAKTHLSISSDPTLRGAPRGWRLPVREARANVGAGFVYLVSGDMRTMPGLSSSPAAERIDIDENGNVVGLY